MPKKTGLNFFGMRRGDTQRLVNASLDYVRKRYEIGSLDSDDQKALLIASATMIFHRGTKKEKKNFLDIVILMDLKQYCEVSSLFFITKIVQLLSSKQADELMRDISIGADGLVFGMDWDSLASLFEPLFSAYDHNFISMYGEQLDSLREEYAQLLTEAEQDENTGGLELREALLGCLEQKTHETLNEMVEKEIAEKVGRVVPK